MINLNDHLLELLKVCLQKHNSDLISIINDPYKSEYSIEFYNQLRQTVGDELILNGFDKEYEPNDYGLKLEVLIDEIGKLFM